MIVAKEEEETITEEEGQDIIWEIEEGEIKDIPPDECGVSIHAINGTSGLHTFKLQGLLKHKSISLILDTGSTHNFIS